MKLFLDQVDALIALFKPACTDVETMTELQALLRNEKEWIRAHYLFTRVRAKNLQAIKAGDAKAETQYCFEEVCAQSLHNMTDTKQPFDPDSPYWIVPLALKLARSLDIDPNKVVEIAMS